MEYLPAPEKTHAAGKPSQSSGGGEEEQMKIIVLIFLLFRSSGSRLCAALSPDGLTLVAFKFAVSGGPLPASRGWGEADEDLCWWPGVSGTNVLYFHINVVNMGHASKWASLS
ncbi:unnamed protein product [Spirodela intermedia]|uniref:Uncharacterized protein n=1 Tax=Spirodela intermedia TaxID=51605 RepID=A0ABN7E7N8_SPIIN|nr:unnamed protein product [Spirodela intermedia]